MCVCTRVEDEIAVKSRFWRQYLRAVCVRQMRNVCQTTFLRVCVCLCECVVL